MLTEDTGRGVFNKTQESRRKKGKSKRDNGAKEFARQGGVETERVVVEKTGKCRVKGTGGLGKTLHKSEERVRNSDGKVERRA